MASRSLGSLVVDLIARIGGFQSGMDQAARLAEDRSRRIDRSMRNVRNAVGTAFAALGGAAIFREVVRSTIESENALKQLEQRILSTGGAAQKTAQQLTAYASELQRASTFDDEAIVAAQTALLSFTNLSGATFDRTTRAALDLATALGQDLTSATRTLGIALNDPERGIARLARAGIQLDESQAALVKRLAESGQTVQAQNLLLSELEKRFGGAAVAAAETFGGALTQVKNAAGDLLEAPGGLNAAKTALQDLAGLLQDPQTVAAANAFTSAIVTGFARVVEELVETHRLLNTLPGARGEQGLFNEAIGSWGDFGRLVAGTAADLKGLLTPLDEIELKINEVDQALNNSWLGTPLRYTLTSREELERIKRDLVNIREVMLHGGRGSVFGVIQRPGVAADAPPVASGDGSTPPKIDPPPTEEFLKLSAALEQQIALYGKTGEAAKIAYEIASGGLDELSNKEQQQLLALGQQYDALVQNSVAAKEAAEQNKQAAQQAAQFREQLQSQLEDVQQFTMSRTELELAAHAERLEVLRAGLEEGLLLENEFHELSIAAAEETQRRITEILDREASQRSNAFIDSSNEILDQTLALTAELAHHDKRAFNLHKTASIASAIINTYEGITKTLAKFPGPKGIALAFLHGVAGFKQVQAIKATSFGGGAVSSSLTSAGGMPEIRDPSSSPQSASAEPQQQKVVQFHIQNMYGWNKSMLDQFMREARDFIEGADVVLISPYSRNGQMLSERR